MSKFYGTVHGDASQTDGTRRGFSSIKVAAQSWDGSVITRMHYNSNNELMVGLEMSEDSCTFGRNVFFGTFNELRQKLEAKETEHAAKDYERFFMDLYDEVVCLVNQYENGEFNSDMLANAIRHTKYRMDHFVDAGRR